MNIKDVRKMASEFSRLHSRKSLTATGYINFNRWDGTLEFSEFIGKLINPSGKYYMPWACSNVEPCPRCKGRGDTSCTHCAGMGSREAYEDDVFWEHLEGLLGRRGLFHFAGEGDPCDTFVGTAVDIDHYETPEEVEKDADEIMGTIRCMFPRSCWPGIRDRRDEIIKEIMEAYK